MKLKFHSMAFIMLFSLVSCTKEQEADAPGGEDMYFPPVSGPTWDTRSASALGWNEAAIEPLKNFLIDNNSRAFIILVNGRIVMEYYFNGHTPTTTWPWNSAGKTLVTAATGVAQKEGLLDINSAVSGYIGNGWTSAPADKEQLITPRHLLAMTSGLSDVNERVTAANLTYVADAGTRWSYHNVFQKQMDVIAAVSRKSFDAYVKERIADKIGMDGFWNKGLIFTIYHSSARGMARFGLLALNKGNWNGTPVVDRDFFNESITASQTLNPSYGYLWWLNGKTGYMLPSGQTSYPGTLVPNAPTDMYAAMGAQDQRIYVVPSRNLVVVRMGDASNPNEPNFAVSGFDNALWERINAVMR
jgi:CubicO group peptidase (beta-lactamase class C family)